MLIITTIGRSGSSFLALFLQRCGIDVGSDKWFKYFSAGMENKKTLAINSMLISELIKGEEINIYDAWSGIHTLPHDVVKDPQFLMHPEIIENWHHVRDDLKIIYLHRGFPAIAASQKKVPQWTAPVYRCFPKMMEKQQADFLAKVDELEIPIKKFKFPSFLDQPNKVIAELKEWLELPNNANIIWDDLKDGKKHD